MDYLIKDLTRLTGISGHAIRKWQERYGILRPRRTPNGYWHYSSEDFFILKSVQNRIQTGQKLNEIMKMGRATLLLDSVTDLTENQRKFVEYVQAHDYKKIQSNFEKAKRSPFSGWVKFVIQPAVVLVGKAWETGLISVAQEHGFSKWLHGFLFQHADKFPQKNKRGWLCVSYPGDMHELSSLMYYSILRSRQVPAWFCGMLPRELLQTEVLSTKYTGVAVSVVMRQRQENLDSLKKAIQSWSPGIQVKFGGFGLRP